MGTLRILWAAGILVSMMLSFAMADYTMVLTDEDKQMIVNEHNDYRRDIGATNMKHMMWNEDLAYGASILSSSCNYHHAHRNWDGSPFGTVGQNLFMSTGGYTPSWAMRIWWYEMFDYNYETGACSYICGHHTQMAWANTNKVGCAKHFCSTLNNLVGGGAWNNAYYFVCNYATAGNVVGQRPYDMSGAPASECNSGYSVDGLCMTNSQCNEEGVNCECTLACYNCGHLNEEDCVCECAPGWTGDNCDKVCEDTSTNCGGGWPRYICDWPQYESFMANKCPLLCGFCEEANEETDMSQWCEGSPSIPATTTPEATTTTTTVPPTTTTTTVPPTTATTTVPPTTTRENMTPGPFVLETCEMDFVRTPHMFARGGVNYPDQTTLESCLQRCFDLERCQAADFCPTRGCPCKLHMLPPTELTYKEGVDHYAITRCNTTPGCTDTFRLTLDNNAVGGEPHGEAEDASACADLCRELPNCLSFDFSARVENPWLGVRCWIHFYDDLELEPKECSDNYVKKDCSDMVVCEEHFEMYVNSYAYDGVPFEEVAEFEVCGQMCRDDPECWAFDWDRRETPVAGVRCWKHYSQELETVGRGNINHYRKVPACTESKSNLKSGSRVRLTNIP